MTAKRKDLGRNPRASRHRSRVLVRLAILAALLAGLAACGGGGGGGDGGEGIEGLAGLSIYPSSPRIEVGETRQFTARGVSISFETTDITVQVAWSVDDESVLTIDAAGLATSVGAGTAVVTAEVNGVFDGQSTAYSDTATVAVGILGGSFQPVSLQGIVAKGYPASEGTRVCATVFYDEGEYPGNGKLERQTDCVLTDAGGGFLISNIRDKLVLLEAVIEDPVESVTTALKSIFARGDDEEPSPTANINEITDGITRAFSTKFGGPGEAGDCSEFDADCVADQLSENDLFFDAVTDSAISLGPALDSEKAQMASMLGELQPTDGAGNDIDPISEDYNPDPDAGGTDAVQEQVSFEYQQDTSGTTVTVRNYADENIAGGVFTSGGLQVDDSVTVEEALRARLVRGGFGDGSGSASGKVFTCWKDYRDASGNLALVENTCSESPTTCEAAGGETALEPHTSESACQANCSQNASPSYFLSAQVGDQFSFAENSCIDNVSLFSAIPVDAHPGNTAADACVGGLEEACAPTSIGLVREFIPPEEPVFGQPSDLRTKFDYDVIATFSDGSTKNLSNAYLVWNLLFGVPGVTLDSTGLLAIEPGVEGTVTIRVVHMSGLAASVKLDITSGGSVGDGHCLRAIGINCEI